MKLRLPRKFYWLLSLVLLAALAGAYFAFLRDARRQRTLTAEAPARVLKTDVRHDIDPETGMKRVKDTIVTFEYEINGRRYEKESRLSKLAVSAFLSWRDVKVCYDPLDTATIDKAELFPGSHACGT